MLTIDLLKGQGIPIKTRPAGATLLAIVIAVPVITTIVMLGSYVQSSIVLKNQKRLLTGLQMDIFKLSDSVKLKEENERQIGNMNACFVEVNEAIVQQIQWSPVLQVLAENMPPRLILSGLSIKSEIESKAVPQRDDPLKKTSIPVAKRVLYVNLYGRLTSGSDEAVLEFLKALNSSSVLSERADNIRLVAQATDERRNIMNYVIECVFKPL
jgi:hypothetical protein